MAQRAALNSTRRTPGLPWPVVTQAPVVDKLIGAVVPMRADWTRPDPAILAFLSSHGRYGIPYNIVYGPGAPSGIVLPELLTSASVIEAIERAGKGGV